MDELNVLHFILTFYALFCAEIPFLLPFQLLLQDKTEKLVYI